MSGIKKVYRKLPLKFRKKVSKYLKIIKGEYEYSQRPVTKSELVEDLKRLGVHKGDLVYVQSSLKSIGKVQGGADAVIDALIEAVGTDGTVAMPAFSIPVGGMKETLERDEVFDPASTPSTVGYITETFRKREGVLRSIHPTSSIAAYGAKAKSLTEGHFKAPSNFGEDTPFLRIIELDGKTIGIGVELDKVSFYHTAEDVFKPFPVKVYMDKIFTAKIRVRDEISEMKVKALDPEVSKTRIDNTPEGDWIRNFITEYLIDSGTLSYGRLGDARTWIMTASEFFKAYEKLAGKNVTIYTTESEYKESGQTMIFFVNNHRSAYSDKRYNYLKEQILQIKKSYKDKGFWDPENKNWIRQLDWTGEDWAGFVPHDWKYAVELQEGATHFAL
jgi:aminoglycoside 3-N-acetyltransferase